jgi:hypothetical protein
MDNGISGIDGRETKNVVKIREFLKKAILIGISRQSMKPGIFFLTWISVPIDQALVRH